MASLRSERADDLHFRVLRLLEENPELSERELARLLSVSNGRLHYCMKALIDKGLVKLTNFAKSKHRLGYAYLLTPAGISRKAEMTANFLRRKVAEYEALHAEIASLRSELAARKGRALRGEIDTRG